jgi:hypothetical protein
MMVSSPILSRRDPNFPALPPTESHVSRSANSGEGITPVDSLVGEWSVRTSTHRHYETAFQAANHDAR